MLEIPAAVMLAFANPDPMALYMGARIERIQDKINELKERIYYNKPYNPRFAEDGTQEPAVD